MYNKILIPIDMSHIERASQMIAAAKTQANENAKFILLNVIDEVPAWAMDHQYEDIAKKHVISAKEELAKIAKQESLNNVESLVYTGHSYNTILHVAEKEEAELIIIGSHHPGMGDYFLGSTAAKVVRHAQCSVYIIR